MTIYLTHMDEYPLVRPVRMVAFGSVRPASTLVEVSRLRPGIRIEIDAIAGIGAG